MSLTETSPLSTVAVDDIEDIINKKQSSPQQQHQTVRITRRRVKKPNQENNNSCENEIANCCSSNPDDTCNCNGGDGEVISKATSRKTVLSRPEQQLSNDISPESNTIYIKTWGCSHNNSDSEYMAGLLGAAGYNVVTSPEDSVTLTILNSCTVKGPSEQHLKNSIATATTPLVLAGCVPQADKSYKSVDASLIGVQQIDRIVEVVEETLKGNKVIYLSAKKKRKIDGDDGDVGRHGRSPGASLSLPKIRKNALIEIVPISTGCLNNCTYCKTKLARGQLASYGVDSITTRIAQVIAGEGIKEIWLTSEDLGAWGIDLGLTIVDLLNAIVEVLAPTSPPVMLRLGMTNPPYILDHLQDISKILSHPNVYEFLHVPVQSGSDSVLLEMKREYGRADFSKICNFLTERHPSITIATDIICGYPTETDPDFSETIELIERHKPPTLFINQFYPRPGTMAARLKRIPTNIVKQRTKQLNSLFLSYDSIDPGLVGSTQRVLVTEVAHDGDKLVGHNKSYQQVLITPSLIKKKSNNSIMGQWVDVDVTKVTKFSMIGGNGKLVYETNTTANKMYYAIITIATIFLIIISTYYSCQQ